MGGDKVLRQTGKAGLVKCKTRHNDPEVRWRFAARLKASPERVEGGKAECEDVFVAWQHNWKGGGEGPESGGWD